MPGLIEISLCYKMKTPNYLLKLFLPLLFFALITSADVSPYPSPSSSLPTPASPPSPSAWDDYSDDPTTPSPPAAPCNSDDRKTLLQIKQAFNNSDIFDTWKPDTDCCSNWNFVSCDPVTGRVNAFNFFGNTRWGRHDLPTIFPSVIGKLTYLTNLVFKNNATGPIPASLAKLKRLVYMELSDNRLSGPIPRFITRFPSLLGLILDNNQLTGPIPRNLSLLPNLNFISLTNNKLSGRIPDDLFSQYKDPYDNGVYLMLGSNNLRGPIPRSLAGIKLRRLDLKSNELTGDASFLFGKNKGLWYLDLSGNKLKFNMSTIEVNREIITLLLNNNKIFGSLPTTLVDVTMLSYFDVSNNRLCGQIPVGGRLQQFGASAYSGNKCLCGDPLPTKCN